MRKSLRLLMAGLLLTLIQWPTQAQSDQDSLYLFAYNTEKNQNKNGLHFAWSADGQQWKSLGPEHPFIKSDYGTWGDQKRMLNPFLYRDQQGLWHLLWALNENDDVFAHAAVDDLILWRRQSYPKAMPGRNVIDPEVSYLPRVKQYAITWLSVHEGDTLVYSATTPDFKIYTPTRLVDQGRRQNARRNIEIDGELQRGTLHKVTKAEVEALIKEVEKVQARNRLWSETTAGDSERFADLSPLSVKIKPGTKEKEISDQLIGIFFEDINYAADGGLYAELVENRGFEYQLSDKQGHDASWTSFKAWSVVGDMPHQIKTEAPLHPNNPHYVELEVRKSTGALINEGFNGIAVKAGEQYNFSMFANYKGKGSARVQIQLLDENDQLLASGNIRRVKEGWQRYELQITASADCDKGRLAILPATEGTLALDMISLFPQKTFMGRKNGLRADLAQAIADIKPSFVRFPGGCVAHGNGIDNIYHWKNTIGPLEERQPQRNIWNYHQSMGLGYFEYFQFCSDIGAEPIPIVAAGVPCQNSSCGGAGQQGGIPLSEMDDYIQDILDLIEWANGSTDTYWGKKRAEAGHPAPFHLKYIGVGNEDLITDVFEERFIMIYEAIKEKHPEIVVIGTVGPWFEGTDYREGWALAKRLQLPMVDEHYYQPPGWFIYNQDYYDNYDRNGPKVYLGEYAAHLPRRETNLESALAEALYLTAVERNGDIVEMASYAPLFAKEGFTQWNPDLIYFNNTEVKPTVGYYVQKMFGLNTGKHFINSDIDLGGDYNQAVTSRFNVSVVRDSQSGDLILKFVNLLPVAINTQLDLSSLDVTARKASRSALTGAPNDRDVKPENDQIEVGPSTALELTPYSLTVLRIPQ